MKKIILLTVLFLTACQAQQESRWMAVDVVDGDTIVAAKINTPAVKIRLADIDAPEHDQPFGQESKTALKNMLMNCPLDWMPQAVDHYGRQVAVIYACGKNVNAEMVRAGFAWVYDRYNQDSTLPALEKSAQGQKRGLWAQDAPVNPEAWRRKSKKQ